VRDRSRLRRRAVLGLLVVAACAAAGVWIAYARDIGVVSRQVASGSGVATTRHGPVEFAERGRGPAVVVLHGAGGGYDQGLAIARAYGGDDFRWIAPSRFGYLRTPLPADASTAAQADALADLIDGLGIDRVAILAMSGGVPPALQFALRHPARTSALVLLSSAPYTPLSAAEQKLPLPAWLYQALFASDFPYWVMTRLARPALESVFDVKPELRRRLSAEEAAFVAGMVDGFAPVSKRTDGLRNEAAAIDPRARYSLERIAASTLVVHARDDGINPFAFGEHTARGVPGAQFLPLENGGHLLLGHVAEVRARVDDFLRAHAPPPAR
jgi:pimeloyl-ACP methyl ester carboxylesterase